MKDIISKALNVLPSVRYYTNAMVFYDSEMDTMMTSVDIKDAFLHKTFGDDEVVVVLQAIDDNYLKVRNIFIATDMEMRRLYRNGKTDFFFHAYPGSQYHSVVFSDLRDCADLNDFENDQYIAHLLQELNANPCNVFIAR